MLTLLNTCSYWYAPVAVALRLPAAGVVCSECRADDSSDSKFICLPFWRLHVSVMLSCRAVCTSANSDHNLSFNPFDLMCWPVLGLIFLVRAGEFGYYPLLDRSGGGGAAGPTRSPYYFQVSLAAHAFGCFCVCMAIYCNGLLFQCSRTYHSFCILCLFCAWIWRSLVPGRDIVMSGRKRHFEPTASKSICSSSNDLPLQFQMLRKLTEVFNLSHILLCRCSFFFHEVTREKPNLP